MWPLGSCRRTSSSSLCAGSRAESVAEGAPQLLDRAEVELGLGAHGGGGKLRVAAVDPVLQQQEPDDDGEQEQRDRRLLGDLRERLADRLRRFLGDEPARRRRGGGSRLGAGAGLAVVACRPRTEGGVA